MKTPVKKVSVEKPKGRPKGSKNTPKPKFLKQTEKYLTKDIRDDIIDRRRLILQLKIKGLSNKEIGKQANCPISVVRKDLLFIQKANLERCNVIERNAIIGESLSVFEEVERRYWEELEMAPAGSTQRKQYLDSIQTARNNQLKLLSDLGFIAKAPTKQTLDINVKTESIQGLTEEAKSLVAMAMLTSKMKALPAPIPDQTLTEHTEDYNESVPCDFEEIESTEKN